MGYPTPIIPDPRASLIPPHSYANAIHMGCWMATPMQYFNDNGSVHGCLIPTPTTHCSDPCGHSVHKVSECWHPPTPVARVLCDPPRRYPTQLMFVKDDIQPTSLETGPPGVCVGADDSKHDASSQVQPPQLIIKSLLSINTYLLDLYPLCMNLGCGVD